MMRLDGKSKQQRRCDVEGCENEHHARSFCINHYRQFLKHGDHLYIHEKFIKKACGYKGCEESANAKGLCNTHYRRLWRNGTTELHKGSPIEVRKGFVRDGIGYIPLNDGEHAIVDPEDVEKLSNRNWNIKRQKWANYAVSNTRKDDKINKRFLRMHRVIMNAKDGEEVDHINHNGLDNRKSNLRICTSSQNKGNARWPGGTSKYRGVSWDKSKKKWSAKISWKDSTINLGRFDKEKDAAKAYNTAAQFLFGEFANLNNA